MNLGLENKVTMVADSQLSIATAAAAALAKEGALLALSAPDNQHLRHVELELARLHIPQGQFRGVIADLDREQGRAPSGARNAEPSGRRWYSGYCSARPARVAGQPARRR